MSHHEEKKGMPEGIRRKARAAGDEDTEGHKHGQLRRATEDEDTEGHKHGQLRRATEDEDTEGHKHGQLRRATEDEDDVEGHGMRLRS